jgi:peroxiredoxin
MFRSGTLSFLFVAAVLAAGTTVAGVSLAAESIPARTPPQAAGAMNPPAGPHDTAWSREAFSLPGLDGVKHTLAEWKGKVIMLNFWATWCPSCQTEISDFIAFQEEYRAQGLQVVGLGLDVEQKLRNVQRTLEINYPILVADPARHANLIRQWGNSSGVIPYTVVIDREGQIIYTHRGPLHRDAFDENVLPLLSGKH